MEEADALGDKVAILATGRLRAVGSALYLKSRYGAGYQVNILAANADDTVGLEDMVKQKLPGAEVLASQAGNLTVSLPPASVPALPGFLRLLEVQPTAALVKEWGLSDTTLEEVFLRLVAGSTEVNAALGVGGARSEHDALWERIGPDGINMFTEGGLEVQVTRGVLYSQEGESLRCPVTTETGRSKAEAQDQQLVLMGDEPAGTAERKLEAEAASVGAGVGAAAAVAVAAATATEARDRSEMEARSAAALAAVQDSKEATVQAATTSQQVMAILLKNVMLQKKQKKTNICNGCVIITLVLLALLTSPDSAVNVRLCPIGQSPQNYDSGPCVDDTSPYGQSGQDQGVEQCAPGWFLDPSTNFGTCVPSQFVLALTGCEHPVPMFSGWSGAQGCCPAPFDDFLCQSGDRCQTLSMSCGLKAALAPVVPYGTQPPPDVITVCSKQPPPPGTNVTYCADNGVCCQATDKAATHCCNHGLQCLWSSRRSEFGCANGTDDKPVAFTDPLR